MPKTATYVARLTDSNALEPLVYRVEVLEERGAYALVRYLEPPHRGKTAMVEAHRLSDVAQEEVTP